MVDMVNGFAWELGLKIGAKLKWLTHFFKS